MVREVTITAYPRVHMGLVDLAGATPRSYGGAGVALGTLPIRTTASQAKSFNLQSDGPTADLVQKVYQAVDNAAGVGHDVRAVVSVRGPVRPHVGLGSSTLVVLSVLLALSRLNRWKTSARDLVQLSGRGRTSGVGITSFFRGGFVVDAGQKGHPADHIYRPSRDPGRRVASLPIGSWSVPTEWRVSLVGCDQDPTIAPSVESPFFASHSPVSRSDVYEQLALLYHGLIPAVVEADLADFARCLRRFQSIGFKREEIDAQPESVQNILKVAWEMGLAAGLSSLGPIVFIIHRGRISRDAWAKCAGPPDFMGPFKFRNRGAVCKVTEK